MASSPVPNPNPQPDPPHPPGDPSGLPPNPNPQPQPAVITPEHRGKLHALLDAWIDEIGTGIGEAKFGE